MRPNNIADLLSQIEAIENKHESEISKQDIDDLRDLASHLEIAKITEIGLRSSETTPISN